MPNSGVREVEDFMLSTYACYLIVMNGDPRKEVIAVGQTCCYQNTSAGTCRELRRADGEPAADCDPA